MAWSGSEKFIPKGFLEKIEKEKKTKQVSSFYDDFQTRRAENSKSIAEKNPVTKAVSKSDSKKSITTSHTEPKSDLKFSGGYQSYADRKKNGRVFTPSTVLGRKMSERNNTLSSTWLDDITKAQKNEREKLRTWKEMKDSATANKAETVKNAFYNDFMYRSGQTDTAPLNRPKFSNIWQYRSEDMRLTGMGNTTKYELSKDLNDEMLGLYDKYRNVLDTTSGRTQEVALEKLQADNNGIISDFEKQSGVKFSFTHLGEAYKRGVQRAEQNKKDNQYWRKLNNYYNAMYADDFDEYSAEPQKGSKLQRGLDGIIRYQPDELDPDRTYASYVDPNTLERVPYLRTVDSQFNDKYVYMSDDEKRLYNLLSDKLGSGYADDYLERMGMVLDKRKTEAESKYQEEMANNHKILGTVGKIGTGTIGGVMSAVDSGVQALQEKYRHITGKEYVPYSSYSDGTALTHTANALSEGVTRDMGSVGKFLYNGTTGIAENALRVSLLGAASVPVMGISAAGNEAVHRGMQGETDAGKVFLSGAVRGTIEAATEAIGFDHLMKLLKSPVSITGLLMQGGIEAGEETVANLAGNIADKRINGDMSDIETYKRELMTQGMTREEASKKAALQYYVYDTLEAAGQGFLSGAIMGAGTTTAGYVNNTVETGRIINDSGGGQAVVNAGLKRDSATQANQYAQKMQAKQENGQTLSNWNVGRQFQKNVQAFQAEKNLVNSVKEGLGVDVELSSELANEDGKTLNGRYDGNNRIDISKNGTTSVPATLGHEVLHFMQNNAPQAYQAMHKYVSDMINSGESNGFKERFDYHKNVNGYNDYVATEELVAELAEGMFGKKSSIDSMVRNNPKMVQTVLDGIKSTKAKVKDRFLSPNTNRTGLKTTYAQLDKFEQMYNSALREAMNNKGNVVSGEPRTAERNSYAGPKAKTANITQLSYAEEMEINGENAETIRTKTGWSRGLEGKWKFEIDDSKSELIDNSKLEEHYDDDSVYYTGRLEDVFKHDELFKAYPQLRGTTIIVQETEPGTRGIAFTNSNQIVVDKRLCERITNEYQDLLNNRQKYIDDIEQSLEYKKYDAIYNDDTLSPEEWLEQERVLRDEFYSSDIGKRYHELRWGNDKSVTKYEFGWTDEAKSVLLHEIQHMIQEIEGFARGASAEYYKKNPVYDKEKIKEPTKRLENIEKKFKEIWNDDINLNLARQAGEIYDKYCELPIAELEQSDYYEEQLDNIEAAFNDIGQIDLYNEYMDAYKELRMAKAKSKLNPRILYQNTAGEIEARDVQHRMNMTAEERQNTFPESMKKNDDVVFAGGGMSYSTEYSFNKQVEDALSGTMKSGLSVYVGKTPNLLVKCGLGADLPMLINQGHLRDINRAKDPRNRHFHGLDKDTIKQLPELLKAPVMVYDSVSEDNKENSICVVTNKKDSDGLPIIASIRANSQNNSKYLDVSLSTIKTNKSNYVTSMYGRSNFFEHIKGIVENDNLLYANKNKTSKLLSDSELQSLTRYNNLRFDTIIHQSRNIVNSQNERVSKSESFERFSLAGDHAKTANFEELQKAMAMDEQGIDAKFIWQETGWGKGQDGLWRFEIDNREAEYIGPEFTEEWATFKLSEVLKHDKLYEAYPELRNLPVAIVSGEAGLIKGSGFYAPTSNGIFLNKDLSNEEKRKVLLHEVQHAIQVIENFAVGEDFDESGEEQYWRSAGELEARDVSDRADMTAKERRNTFPESMEKYEGLEVIQWHDHPYYKALQEQKARNEAEKERQRQKNRERYQRKKQQKLENELNGAKMDDAGVRYSVAEGEDVQKITRNMLDVERYRILKDKNISLVEYDKTKLSNLNDVEVSDLENAKVKIAKPLLRKIAEQFGITGKTYANSDIELEFNYSKGSLNESIQKQHERYDDFAKMLSVFDKVVENAIGVEVHSDRYKGTIREDIHNINNYVLVSAFSDGNKVVPVRMMVKEFDDKANTLYVTISLNKIENDFHTQTLTNEYGKQKYAPSSSTISLPEIIKKVNVSDGDFLKYLPDDFLNEEQKEAKREAIRKESEYIKQYEKPKERYSVKESAGDVAISDKTSEKLAALMQEQGVSSPSELAPDTVTREQSKKDRNIFRGRQGIRNFMSRAYTLVVDDMHPFWHYNKAYEKVSDKTNYGKENPYKLAINAKDASSRSAYIVSDKMVDFDNNEVGEGLVNTITNGGITEKNYNNFNNYLVARHALEWLNPDEHGSFKNVYENPALNDVDVVSAMVADFERKNPEFKQAAESLYEWQRQLMQTWLVDTGVITQEQYNRFTEMYPDYVPFFREQNVQMSRNASGGFANQGNPFKQAVGTQERRILQPIENIMYNVASYVNHATKHTVTSSAVRLYDILESDPENNVLRQYWEEVEPVNPDDNKPRYFRTKDSQTADIQDVTQEEENSISQTLKEQMGVQDGVVTIIDNGRKRYFRVNDADFLTVLDNVKPKMRDGFLSIMASFSRTRAALITSWNPAFSLASNPMRDFGTLITNSSDANKAKVVKEALSAYVDVAKSSEAYKQYLSMGGQYSSVTTDGMDAMKIAMQKLKAKDPNMAKRFFKLFPKMFNGYQTISDAIESAPRMSEFKTTLDKGHDFHEAFFRAKDVTTNFSRGGKIAKDINSISNFFNASIQGVDKFFRQAKNNPKSFAVGVSCLAAIELLAWAWNTAGDDEEKEEAYDNLSNYTKNNFYNFYIGGGEFISIPKARESAVLATSIGATLNSLVNEQDDRFKGFFSDYIKSQFIPDWSLVGYSTYKDLSSNKDYLGRPIISAELEKLPAELQYDEDTSYFAKWLGGITKQSPKQIDHIINSEAGVLGKVNRTYFSPSGQQDKATMFTFGVNTTFNKDSLFSTDHPTFFYNNKEEAEKQANGYPSADNGYLSNRYYQAGTVMGILNEIYKEDTESEAGREMRRAYVNYAKEYKKNPMGLSDDVYNEIKDLYDADPTALNMPTIQRELKMKIGKENKSFTFNDAESLLNYQKDLNKGVDEAYRKLLSDVSYNAMSDLEKVEALNSAKSEATKAVKKFYIENKGKESMYTADGATNIVEPSKSDVEQYRQKLEYQEDVTKHLQTIADNVAKAVPDKANDYSVSSMQINDIQSAKIDGKSYKISGDTERKIIEAANDVHYSNVEKLMNNEINVEDVIGYTATGRARTSTQADGTKVQLTGKLYNDDGTPRFDEVVMARIMYQSKEAAKDQAIEQYKDEIAGTATPTFTPTPTSDTSAKVSSNTASSGGRARFTSAKASGGSSSKATTQTGNKVRFTGRASTAPTRSTQIASAHLPNVVTPKAVNTDIMQQAVNSFMKNAEIKPIQPLKNPLTM